MWYIWLAFVRTREAGVSSRNVVSLFPSFFSVHVDTYAVAAGYRDPMFERFRRIAHVVVLLTII